MVLGFKFKSNTALKSFQYFPLCVKTISVYDRGVKACIAAHSRQSESLQDLFLLVCWLFVARCSDVDCKACHFSTRKKEYKQLIVGARAHYQCELV
jgi:hypothetical protein